MPKTKEGSKGKEKGKTEDNKIDLNALFPELQNQSSSEENSQPKIDLNALRQEGNSAPLEETNKKKEQGKGNVPKALKNKIEKESGVLLDDVTVHYNSQEPFKYKANAFAKGNEVFLAPGQEELLSEELWHVVQQKQGLVKPTGTENGVPTNDAPDLERLAKKGQSENGGKEQSEEQKEVIQKNDEKLTFTIPVKGTMTGREFMILIEKQIYGQVVNTPWRLNGASIAPNQIMGKEGVTTPYKVSVFAASYKRYRAGSEKGAGVEVDETGTVEGAEERSKELDALPEGTKGALIKEIDRRFREASGKAKKEPGDEALWNVYRDEVLAQRAKILSLSEKAKKLIVEGEDKGGIVISPSDYPKAIALIEKIEALNDTLVTEYASRVTGKASSLEEMQNSLDRFIQEQEDRGDNKKERTEVENELFATDKIFDDLKMFRTLGVLGSSTSLTFYEEASKAAKERGFKDLDDYAAKTEEYIASFQKESVAAGIGLLQKYEHFLYEEEQRYLNSTDAKKLGDDVAQSGAKENYENSDQNASNASLAEFAMGTTNNSSKQVEDNIQNYKDLSDQQEIAANTAMQGFSADHPLLADPAFDVKKLSKQSPEDTQQFLLDYIKKQKESIANTKAKMQGDEEFVFKLDNLMTHMYLQEGITADSLQENIIQNHIKGIQLKDAFISIGIALLALGLGLLSGGTGTVGVMAAVGSAGLSIYDVTREFGKYTEEQNAHDVGMLSKEPSFAWVMLSLVGAGLDFVVIAKMLKPLQEPVESFTKLAKTDPATALAELEVKLKGIDGIGDALRANMLKRAENQIAYTKAKKGLKGMMRVELIPYSTELFTWAVYAVKSGITRVDDFLLWLKREKIIKDIITKDNLTKDQIQALQIAMKQARDNVKFVDNVLTPNLSKRLSAEPERFVALEKQFNDEELLQIVNAGKMSKLDDLEIEDIILNACRKNKNFDANEVMKQMATWSKVKKQGFPTIFESLEDYQKFSATVKDLAKKWNVPADNIAIQGSSLRVEDVSKIGDLDVTIRVDKETFDKLVQRFRDNVTSDKVSRRIGNNGKIGGNDMFDGGPSLILDFYNSFKSAFGVEFPVKLKIPKIQISIIEKGSKLSVSPFLDLK